VVVAEELYGLCKLQLHPRNFKALRAAASAELCAPVVALLGTDGERQDGADARV
jgi:hypothetical protein